MADGTLALSSTGTNTDTAGTWQLGSGGNDVVASTIVEISSVAGGFSGKFYIQGLGSAATAITARCLSLQDGSITANNVAITANGVYAVFAPACRVTLVVTAGTATGKAWTVAGRTH